MVAGSVQLTVRALIRVFIYNWKSSTAFHEGPIPQSLFSKFEIFLSNRKKLVALPASWDPQLVDQNIDKIRVLKIRRFYAAVADALFQIEEILILMISLNSLHIHHTGNEWSNFIFFKNRSTASP